MYPKEENTETYIRYRNFLYKDLSVRETTEDEHNNSIEIMASHLDSQDNGKVGIFWYDRFKKVLFGVIAVDKDSIAKPNAGGGLITCSELHTKVWQKGYNKQKYKLNGEGPFRGDYKDTPRGRVFYNPASDSYEIKVGNWIDEYPDAINEIIEEFDLQNCKKEVIKDFHWDIGNGWENL